MAILLKPDSSPKKKQEMIVIALRDTVVFPDTEATLTFGRPQSIKAIKQAYEEEQEVLFVCQKEPRVNNPDEEDIYHLGTVGRLENVLKSGKSIYVIVSGQHRAQIASVNQHQPFMTAQVEPVPALQDEGEEVGVLANLLLEELRKAASLGKALDPHTLGDLSPDNPLQLVNRVAMVLNLDGKKRQELLETDSLHERLEKTTEYLAEEIKVLELDQQINSKAQDQFDKSMREAVLKQRRKMIDKELGEMGAKKPRDPEIRKLQKAIKETKMPLEIKKKAKEELQRLAKLPAMNPESGYLRNYLDWLTNIPWQEKSPNDISLAKAEEILDEDHYGLEKIKERILEHLAVMQLQGKKKTSNSDSKDESDDQQEENTNPTILCFIGPPGVGKTSVGRSIARALGREFVRVSLGGMRDEAEIRGHRRTYVGALPGRIIQGMKEAGTVNPVFMLDEIDKLGQDFRGDPSAALLEALDPEQNKEFSDHYLNVPYDLSEVFFVATGNVLDTIPPALQDRLEIIRFPGYTDEEKFHIAKKYLWPKQAKAQALGEDYQLTTQAYYEIIRKHTREAGVRQLERELARVGRKLARKIAEDNKVAKKIRVKVVRDLLGPAKFSRAAAEKEDEVARSTGLAWTKSGGEILFVEVALMPGKGKILLTGQLGDVMKESCQAAISYVRSNWQDFNLNQDFAKGLDIHVHVPEGAVPKDGPSAGVAIATAVVSSLTGRKVYHDVGMTGEITLRGRVLEVGGIKEKVLAAHRAGLSQVVLPVKNEKNLEDIPQKVRDKIEFSFVEDLDQVLKIALEENK